MHTEDFCAIVEPGITREGLNQVKIFEKDTSYVVIGNKKLDFIAIYEM